MEALNFNNILGADEIDNLFSGMDEIGGKEAADKTPDDSGDERDTEETEETAETVTSDELFEDDEEQSESVGSGKDDKGTVGDASSDSSGPSPNNLYSSIANAMAVDGVFPNLDDDILKKVSDAESFSEALEAEVNARLDEKQRRIAKALENGVEPNDISNYERTLNYISSIRESDITAENDQGEEIRYRLILQDYLNKGYSQERAEKYTKRSIDSGNDVEDAKEALQSNKEFFQKKYDKLLQEAQAAADAEKADREKQAASLRKSLMEDKNLLGDIDINKDLRKKAFDAISRPVYKDPETGGYLTALQKFEREHRTDLIKYMGLFMTLTNGFKDFDTFTKGKVKKEMRKGMKDLERILTGSKRNTDGNMRLVTNVSDDSGDYISKGYRLSL